MPWLLQTRCTHQTRYSEQWLHCQSTIIAENEEGRGGGTGSHDGEACSCPFPSFDQPVLTATQRPHLFCSPVRLNFQYTNFGYLIATTLPDMILTQALIYIHRHFCGVSVCLPFVLFPHERCYRLLCHVINFYPFFWAKWGTL